MRLLRLLGLGAAAAAVCFAFCHREPASDTRDARHAGTAQREKRVLATEGDHEIAREQERESAEEPEQLPPIDVDGLVVDDLSGEPRAGVAVELLEWNGRQHTKTDRQGRFSFSGIAAGQFRVTAETGGAGVTRTLYGEGGETLRVVLALVEKATLQLRVVDAEQRPIAGAQALIFSEMNTREEAMTVALGGSGETSLALVPGNYWIRAEAPRSVPFEERITLASGDRWTHQLMLSPGAPVTVRVFDGTGAPLEGAIVQVIGGSGAGVATDSSGLAALGNVNFGAQLLYITGANLPPVEIRAELLESEGYGERVFEHHYGPRTVRGFVRTPDGKPAVEQGIEFRPENGEPTATTYADEKGYFQLSGLDPVRGTVNLQVGVQLIKRDVDLGGGDANVDLEIPSHLEISGRVPECADLGPGACTVYAIALDAIPDEYGPRMETTLVFDRGQFRFEFVDEGRFQLFAYYSDGGGMISPEALATITRVAARAGDKNLELHLEGTVRVRGHVRFEGGARPKRISVSAQGREESFSGADFSLDRLLPGSTVITVSADGFVTTSTTVDIFAGTSKDADLLMRGARSFSAYVLDDRTGAPLDDATIRLWRLDDDEGRYLSAMSDADGAVDIPDLIQGRWTIEVRHPERAIWRGEIRIDGEPSVMEIRLGRGAVVTGTVRDHQGRPVAGTEVLLISTDGDNEFIAAAHRGAPTDAAGRFRFPCVSAGAYTVQVASAFAGGSVRELHIGDSGVEELDFQLEEAVAEHVEHVEHFEHFEHEEPLIVE